MGPGPAGVLQLQELFTRIINLSVGIAFIALLIVLAWASIKFLTSGGDAKAIGQASQAITWGLLGILFLVLVWLILQLIKAFTGVDVTTFCIGFPGVPTACK